LPPSLRSGKYFALSGQRIERKEVGPPGAFDDLSDDQLERAIIERFRLH